MSKGGSSTPLELSGSTEFDPRSLEAQRLPRGAKPGTEWTPLGVTRAVPEVQPQRPGQAGGAGEAGTGAASWRRRLSPEHREAVKRFFDQDPTKR